MLQFCELGCHKFAHASMNENSTASLEEVFQISENFSLLDAGLDPVQCLTRWYERGC